MPADLASEILAQDAGAVGFGGGEVLFRCGQVGSEVFEGAFDGGDDGVDGDQRLAQLGLDQHVGDEAVEEEVGEAEAGADAHVSDGDS